MRRLWISSLTDESIREGFSNLKPQSDYDRLFQAGLSRAIGDWILGMNATRLYTLKYGGRGHVLSIGRVQTPTLALIVKRHHEIANFVPKDSWELHTRYREVDFTYTGDRFDSEAPGEEAVRRIAGEIFTITSVTKKKVANRPAPVRPHLATGGMQPPFRLDCRADPQAYPEPVRKKHHISACRHHISLRRYVPQDSSDVAQDDAVCAIHRAGAGGSYSQNKENIR